MRRQHRVPDSHFFVRVSKRGQQREKIFGELSPALPPAPLPPCATQSPPPGSAAARAQALAATAEALAAQLPPDVPPPTEAAAAPSAQAPSTVPAASAANTAAGGDGGCELEAAVAELVARRKNKYVQKKSSNAYRLEPHLPREVAGAGAEDIGRTRLAGYGLLTTAERGGIFRELLVCSTSERWWSCVPEDITVRCASPPPSAVCECVPGARS